MFPPDEAKGWRPKGVLQMDYTQIASRLMVAQGRTQGALILSLVRIPDWYRHLAMHAMHGIPGPFDLTWRVGGIAILHFLWPLALLYVALKIPYWIILSLYQPNLVIWLESVAAVVFLRGVLQIALDSRVFSQSH